MPSSREEGELSAEEGDARTAPTLLTTTQPAADAPDSAAAKRRLKKKRKREAAEAHLAASEPPPKAGRRAAVCCAHLRGVCPLGAACGASHDAAPCRQWAAGTCTRAAACPFVHAGGPGSAAAQAQLAQAEPGREVAPPAAPPGLAFVPVPTFSPDQARRFRELLAAPDAAARLAEFRALVGPLLPLRPGAPPAGAPPERDPHASNCG